MVIFNSSGNYLKIDDVNEGDTIVIKSEGVWQESKFTYADGNPKQDFVMNIDHKGEEKVIRINKFSREEIIPIWGNDSKEWVGKTLKIMIENYRSLGKKGMVFTPATETKQPGTVEQVDAQGNPIAWDE